MNRGWKPSNLFGKATAIGIPFYRGEFGWWNQALLFILGAGTLSGMKYQMPSLAH